MAKAIMVQGTTSNAGKSLLTAALCRIFKQDGYRVAPFKAQNMALNSYITADGMEMGRAQVMQAEAAGVAPDVRMNPILLKPTSDSGSQVIVNGKPIGNRSAAAYYAEKAALRPLVQRAYDSLAAEYDIIVIEGAGSPAEINLKQDDLVNMGMAKMAHAPVLLVGDIDRGGVFAALYGTVALLDETERAHVKGLVVNKFRGDVEILRPGLSMLTNLVHKPVLGVVPYTVLDLDDEDSLSERLSEKAAPALVKIAVPRLPRLSNFTDLNALARIEGVRVQYVSRPDELADADLIVLPGSKNTMEDLRWLRQAGLEAQICKCAAAGVPVFGVCGGYQMMGRRISDPAGTESGGELAGMGLLPTETVFEPEKMTTQVQGQVLPTQGVLSALGGAVLSGYEIHMGRTTRLGGAPLTVIDRGGTCIEEGCQYGSCYGTYVHGIFDTEPVAKAIIGTLLTRKGYAADAVTAFDSEAYKQAQYDKLAQVVRASLDMEQIYRILQEGV